MNITNHKNNKLIFKIIGIILMSLLLLIPLMLIDSTISDRQSHQSQVIHNIAESFASWQKITAPVIAIRYLEEKTSIVETRQSDSNKINKKTIVNKEQKVRLFVPDQINITGEVKVETRKRGIYKAPLYNFTGKLEGKLSLDSQAEIIASLTKKDISVSNIKTFLVMGVTDTRGFSKDPWVNINGENYRFSRESGFIDGSNLAISLDKIAQKNKKTIQIDISFPLVITGTSELKFSPIANNNTINIQANWPHPNFGGRFLPTKHNISDEGFSASWQVSHLARDFQRAASNTNEVMSIKFIDPVNIYVKSRRAVKYGILFIILTFGAFFFSEIIRKKPIHFMQYLLVGLALAIFFLLLVALSEHINFSLAYLISSVACIGVISYYLAGSLADEKNNGYRLAAYFGAGLTGIYGVLYGILSSEDNALIMGSVFLFVALSAIMVATRKLNWHNSN